MTDDRYVTVLPAVPDRIFTRLRPVLVLGLIALGYSALASTSASIAKATDYCGVEVPAYTDCASASGGSWVNGYFNYNWAHAQNSIEGEDGLEVCEHVYIEGTGDTVSNHCEKESAYSFCDLYGYYKEGIELSGHAVNDEWFKELIWGHAKVVTENVCT